MKLSKSLFPLEIKRFALHRPFYGQQTREDSSIGIVL